MQSRLRKEGSIPEPILTDSSLAKPGNVLQVIINCAHHILYPSPAGTDPRSHQDKRRKYRTCVEQAPGELPPDTSEWKSHQALLGTLALIRETDTQSGHREREKLNHLLKIELIRDIQSIFCATKVHGNLSPRI